MTKEGSGSQLPMHGLRRPTLALLCALALQFLPPATVAGEALAERHRPTGMPLRLWLDDAGKPLVFSAYLRTAKAAIGKYRWVIPDESPAERQAHVELIAPREWPRRAGCDSRKTEGVLLIHGLTDSPFLMRDLGDFFNRLPRCLLVRSILLPGHASAPGDLTRVSYEDWVEAARYGIESFKGEVASLHVAGFSTGGALAIYWAFNNKDLDVPIESLLLFSPAIRPTGQFLRLNLLPRIVEKVSEFTGIAAWLDVFADQDYAKYESFAMNAGYQIYRLDQKLKDYSGARLHVPVFMALSRDDATINAEDSVRFFLDSATENSRMMLVARDAGEKVVKLAAADKRVEVRTAQIPADRVIDFAHTSFVASPDNPHYGRKGDYAECLAYAKDNKDKGGQQKYCQCITPKMIAPQCSAKGSEAYVYGEHDEASVKANVLRRLTFNPYFAQMTRQLEEFMRGMARR